MDRTEKTELAVLCLLRSGSRILVQNREKADWRGIVLPGGHVEPGESIVDAVAREMQEETGYQIQRPKLCGIKQFPGDYGRYLVFLFSADSFSGTLQSSPEGEVFWVERDAVSSLPTAADFEALLSVFEQETLTEFQYVPGTNGWDVIIK